MRTTQIKSKSWWKYSRVNKNWNNLIRLINDKWNEFSILNFITQHQSDLTIDVSYRLIFFPFFPSFHDRFLLWNRSLNTLWIRRFPFSLWWKKNRKSFTFFTWYVCVDVIVVRFFSHIAIDDCVKYFFNSAFTLRRDNFSNA